MEQQILFRTLEMSTNGSLSQSNITFLTGLQKLPMVSLNSMSQLIGQYSHQHVTPTASPQRLNSLNPASTPGSLIDNQVKTSINIQEILPRSLRSFQPDQ